MQDLYEIEKDPPGEGTGGVAPSCPARRYGGMLQAPPSGSGSPTAKLCLVEIHLQLLWLHPFLTYSLLPPSLTPSIPISLPFFHSHCCTLHITIHMHGGGCMNSLCEYVLFLRSLPGQLPAPGANSCLLHKYKTL